MCTLFVLICTCTNLPLWGGHARFASWGAFGHMGAPCGRMGAFSTYPVQISQICDGKFPLSQPALSDPVQIRDGKSPLSQPALIVSDPVQISQIRDGKSTLSQPA